jgi:beta-phosphoglucomutase-like phosphatase (HAD superfamily)
VADLIVTAARTARTVTIVSNNSGAAIECYLAGRRFASYSRAIVARDDHDPGRMKPDPYRVCEAIDMLGADKTECTLIGDSKADVFAGLLAGVTVIGYATRADKVRILEEIQAAAVITELADVTTALRRSGPLSDVAYKS